MDLLEEFEEKTYQSHTSLISVLIPGRYLLPYVPAPKSHLQRCSICDLAHIQVLYTFSHPSLVIYFFFVTSPTKSKLGKQIGGGLVIASEPPGPIIYGRPIGNNDE